LCNFRCEAERDIKCHVIRYVDHRRRQEEARMTGEYQTDETYFHKNLTTRMEVVGKDIT